MGCFGKRHKTHHCKIVLLDETDMIQEIQDKTRGQYLMETVFKHLNLLETAYFGLRYLDKSGETRWLDPIKKVAKQLKGTSPFTLYFGVKFYASDPCKLLEEITRYQFFLQVKQDILEGRLPVAFDLAGELFALSVQSELGDYDSRRHHDRYVSEFCFVPNQTPELESKVVEIHKGLVGQVPSTVELSFLERVKWLDMYGVDLHPVMGEDNIEYFLGLTPSGVIVLKNKAKVSNYFWPRITKVYFKGKYFMLRVRDKTNDENTYGFELPSKQACKYLWKCCVEHHAFFRLTQVKELPGHPINIFSLGSKYRYSGRTEQQIRMEMKQLKRSPPTVVRIPSRRYQKRLGEPDGADAGTQGREEVYRGTNSGDVKSILPVSQTVCSSSLYRSISTPAALSAADSPKSTKSAPWENPNHRGLFPNLSRQSLQSTHTSERKHSLRTSSHRRSTSLDSESSWDSRRRKRELNKNAQSRHHKSKRSSDNDSDISKSSRGSRGSKSSRGGISHRKTRSHSRESGSDSDSYHRRRGRKHSSRKSGSKYDLVESELQWKMVQKQQQEKKSNPRPQNAVVRDLSNRKSGYMNSGIDTESEVTLHHRRKHRRHSRSRSRSPDTKHGLSSDVKKHIEYDLIDPTNMTEEEKKDIKYTKVQTEDNVFKIRCSPASGKNRYKIAKVPSKTSLDYQPPRKPTEDDDPPPPYTPSAINGNASQENFKQLGWNYEINATSSASFSTAQISDSSSSSISSALKSRERTVHPVSNSTAIALKGRSTKQLNGSLQELSSSTHSSGTEKSSKNRIVNGNSYNPSNIREPPALTYQKKQNVSSDSKVATGHIHQNHTKQSTDMPPTTPVQSLSSIKSLNQQSQNSHEMSTEL